MQSKAAVATVTACTVAFLAVDGLLLSGSNVRLMPQNLTALAKALASGTILWSIAWLVDRRLADDRTRIAAFIRRVAATVRLLTYALVLFVPLTFATSLFMFLATATQAPLSDPMLAEVDLAMGFDWTAFHDALSGPVVSTTLIFAYHALGPQVPLVLLYHAAMLRRQRVMEFLCLLALSAIPTALGMYLFPAAGAYSLYQIDPGAFTAQAGMWHYERLLALRSGAPFDFLVTEPAGLTTFPSFHTALGIMVIYSLRSAPLAILLPISAVNAAMIVSTIPEGGHYLIDVIAGVGVAIFAIFAVKKLSQESRGTLASDARIS